MKWRKITHVDKWTLYEDGKHVASIAFERAGLLHIWVDGGNGFQELQNIAIGSGIRDLKALAVSALVELRERIACGDVREGNDETLKIGNDGGDLSLLQHDLG